MTRTETLSELLTCTLFMVAFLSLFALGMAGCEYQPAMHSETAYAAGVQ